VLIYALHIIATTSVHGANYLNIEPQTELDEKQKLGNKKCKLGKTKKQSLL
jgi:hypothetical protein